MGIFDKAGDEVDKLQNRFSQFKGMVTATVNPNHRHDEEHEKAEDRQRTSIAKSHRFESFASQKEGNSAKWYLDGRDYFYALSELLEGARESIMISDWWLSPELALRRPLTDNEQWRLDRTLQRAAQRGVRVFVIVYKEVTQAMTLGSGHSKHALERLHQNIAVVRHPDHLGGDVAEFYSHHEKIVVIDAVYACVGGLDLCYGRMDSHSAKLSDFDPSDVLSQVFPGQDYNNARVEDFKPVDQWCSNGKSRLTMPRMPWHDVHQIIQGQAVHDIAQHQIERWNFIKNLKYKHDDRYPLLDWTAPEPLPDALVRHPHTGRLREFGKRFGPPKVILPDDHSLRGNMTIQAVRGSADWSHGILTEHSIMNAYCQLIMEANHHIYIENQFFVTNANPNGGGPVRNSIGAALVQRIYSAYQNNERFRVVVVIPTIPCFAGDLRANAGILAIMHYQYQSINRGPNSIFENLRKLGVPNPEEYISFYNLRSYDRIKYDPEIIAQMERDSGVKWAQVQAAIARLNIGGDNPFEIEYQMNKAITIQDAPVEAESTIESKDKKKPIEKTPIPNSAAEAYDMINRFQAACPPEAANVRPSIADDCLQNGRSVRDEAWYGTEASELGAFVSEELYIHTKLMIVDDRRTICGSANLNERSQIGDHDSEIAIVVEDTDMMETTMNGQKFMAGRYAATLRRQLFAQHLGLIPPQDADCRNVTAGMRPVGVAGQDFTELDPIVNDPLSPELEQLWKSISRRNTDIFSDLFHCTPAPNLRTWKEYTDWVPSVTVGHLHPKHTDVRAVKEQLSQIRGHLVDMPLDFLENENMVALSASVNPVTLQIYL